jgi:hypothetical protein
MNPALDPTQDPRLRMPPAVLPTANGAPSQPATAPVLPRAGQVAIPSQATKNPTSQAPLSTGASPEQITGQDTMPVARPAPGSSTVQPSSDAVAHKAELSRLQSSGSGISQIHNPILRTLGTIGDVASSFFPRAAALVPGTTLHHQMLLRNAGSAVSRDTSEEDAEQKRQLEAAQTDEAQAKASQGKDVTPHTLQTAAGIMQFNPATQRFDIPAGQTPPKEEVEGKTVTTDQGIMQWNPQTQRYDVEVGKAPGAKGGTVHQLDDGSLIIAHPDGTATPVTVNGQPAKGKQTDKTENQEQQFVDEYRKTNAKATVAEAQRAFKKNEQLPPQTDRGQNFVDPATHKLIRVEPGGAVPENAVTPGGQSSESVGADKEAKAQQKATADAARDYKLAQTLVSNPSPTNDLALVMQYVGSTKPESLGKLRLNNNEVNLVYGTRSSLGDLEALVSKVSTGQSLTPKQRQDMLSTMKILAESRGDLGGGAVPKPGEMFNGHKVLKVEKVQ